MKQFRKTKLNQRGFGHVEAVIAILVIAGIAAVGARVLFASHAQTPDPVIAYQTVSATPLSESVNTANVYSGAVSTISPNNLLATSPRYSTNGQYIAWEGSANPDSTNTGQIGIYNTQTNTQKVISLPTGTSFANSFSDLQWYPSNTKLAFVAATEPTGSFAYQLETINTDGTGATVVPNVNAGNESTGSLISSLAVTGDGQYIVYSNGSAVYSVMPGSQPVLMTKGECSNIRTVPGTSDTVVYYCGKNHSNGYTQTIYRGTTASKKSSEKIAAIFTYTATKTTKVGTTYQFINSFMPSSDGSTLAIDNQVTTVTAACTANTNISIGTLPINSTGTLKTLYTGPSTSVSNCRGGGGGDINDVVWSPSGSSIAYLGANSSLNVLSSLNSTAVSKQLVAGNAGDLSW